MNITDNIMLLVVIPPLLAIYYFIPVKVVVSTVFILGVMYGTRQSFLQEAAAKAVEEATAANA